MSHRSSIKETSLAHMSNDLSKRRANQIHIHKDKRQHSFMAKRRTAGLVDVGRSSTISLSEVCTKLKQAKYSNSELLELLQDLHFLLSNPKVDDLSSIEEAIQLDIIPVFLNILQTKEGNLQIQIQIVYCLPNLTSGSHLATKQVLPCCPFLIHFLSSPSEDLSTHAAMALGNIAADCEEFRLHLRQNGVISPMIRLLSHKIPAVVRASAWALSNLIRGDIPLPTEFLQPEVSTLLVNLLQTSGENSVVTEVGWILTFLSARDESVEVLIRCGLCEAVSSLFSNLIDDISILPILRIIGNLISGDLETGNHLLQQKQVLPRLHLLLSQPHHRSLLKEATWVVSNVAAHSVKDRDEVVALGFLPCVATHFRDGCYDIRKEAAFFLWNIAFDGTYLENVLQEEKVLEGFLQLASVPDASIVVVTLKFIDLVLRKARRGVHLVESLGGIDVLENLQYNEIGSRDSYIANWANGLVNEFYGENYEEDQVENIKHVEQEFFSTSNLPLPSAGRGTERTKPAWMK